MLSYKRTVLVPTHMVCTEEFKINTSLSLGILGGVSPAGVMVGPDPSEGGFVLRYTSPPTPEITKPIRHITRHGQRGRLLSFMGNCVTDDLCSCDVYQVWQMRQPIVSHRRIGRSLPHVVSGSLR